jgi:hypothetical protein
MSASSQEEDNTYSEYFIGAGEWEINLTILMQFVVKSKQEPTSRR